MKTMLSLAVAASLAAPVGAAEIRLAPTDGAPTGDHSHVGLSPRLTASLQVADLTPPSGPGELRSNAPAPLSFSDHDGGPSGQDAHVGPMWIMMGAMMVAMMLVAGAYMMRGHGEMPLHPALAVAPHQAAFPSTGAFRPGG